MENPPAYRPSGSSPAAKTTRSRNLHLHVWMAVLAIISVNALRTVAQTSQMNPRDQLRQFAADLQKNPSDDSLREKIIKLALTLNPTPAAPPEVDEIVGRAKYAIEHATSTADFAAAADIFAKASLLAPWVPDYYFNQAVAYEKAQQLNSAIKHFQWYLMAAPEAQDAKAVRERIGGLRFAAEKAAQETAERQVQDQRLAQINQAWQLFKQKVERLVYYGYICEHLSMKEQNRGRSEGCNWAEYNGSNWSRWQGTAHFRFPSPGKVEFIKEGASGPMLVGSFQGPSIRDLKWDLSDWKAKPWLDFSGDGQWIAYSLTRPPDISPDDPRFDKQTRHLYEGFQPK